MRLGQLRVLLLLGLHTQSILPLPLAPGVQPLVPMRERLRGWLGGNGAVAQPGMGRDGPGWPHRAWHCCESHPELAPTPPGTSARPGAALYR